MEQSLLPEDEGKKEMLNFFISQFRKSPVLRWSYNKAHQEAKDMIQTWENAGLTYQVLGIDILERNDVRSEWLKKLTSKGEEKHNNESDMIMPLILTTEEFFNVHFKTHVLEINYEPKDPRAKIRTEEQRRLENVEERTLFISTKGVNLSQERNPEKTFPNCKAFEGPGDFLKLIFARVRDLRETELKISSQKLTWHEKKAITKFDKTRFKRNFNWLSKEMNDTSLTIYNVDFTSDWKSILQNIFPKAVKVDYAGQNRAIVDFKNPVDAHQAFWDSGPESDPHVCLMSIYTRERDPTRFSRNRTSERMSYDSSRGSRFRSRDDDRRRSMR